MLIAKKIFLGINVNLGGRQELAFLKGFLSRQPTPWFLFMLVQIILFILKPFEPLDKNYKTAPKRSPVILWSRFCAAYKSP
jgi:hypothetical protein